jgi:hypothetical protein
MSYLQTTAFPLSRKWWAYAGQDGEVEEAEPSSEKGAVHVVTAEEAEAGTYAITDVVLPQPGHSVEYPRHATGQVCHPWLFFQFQCVVLKNAEREKRKGS